MTISWLEFWCQFWLKTWCQSFWKPCFHPSELCFSMFGIWRCGTRRRMEGLSSMCVCMRVCVEGSGCVRTWGWQAWLPLTDTLPDWLWCAKMDISTAGVSGQQPCLSARMPTQTAQYLVLRGGPRRFWHGVSASVSFGCCSSVFGALSERTAPPLCVGFFCKKKSAEQITPKL